MEANARRFAWILLLPAVLPLLYVQSVMYPLMAPKTILFRSLGVLALSLFVWGVLSGWKFFWSRLQRWEAWIPGALLFVAYAASLLSVDFSHSFWSTFARGDGLLTLSVCIGFFYLILLVADASWLRSLLRATAWVGSIAAAYLCVQWIQTTYGINIPFILETRGRVGGTLGNAAFYSAYAAMAFFAILAVRTEYDGWKRVALTSGAALSILAILLAATRGTLLALLLLGAVLIAYLAWKGEGNVRSHAQKALAALAVIAALAVMFRAQLAQVPFEPLQRFATISLEDATVESRLFIWGNMLKQPEARSLLGSGAEHIDILFDRFYDPTGIFEEWFDRSHNAYLDYLVQFGILGFALYLALVVVAVRLGFLLWKDGNRYGPFVLGMALVYALQNFFVFDTVATLWLFLALFAALLAYRSKEEKRAFFSSSAPRRAVGGVIAAAILLLLIPVAVQPVRANLLTFEAYFYQIIDVPRAGAAAEKTLSLGTYADLELGYNAYSVYTDHQMQFLSGDELEAAYENAKSVLSRAFLRYPYDARTATYYAQVLANAPVLSSEDRQSLHQAVARAIELSPKRAQPWYILANIAITEGNRSPLGSTQRAAGYSAAEEILRQYLAFVPTYSEARYVLAEIELVSGDVSGAAEDAVLGKEHYRSNIKEARRAVGYYVKAQDYENLEFFLAEVVRLDSSDFNSLYDLAKVTFVNGNPEKAAELVRELRQKSPVTLETDPDFLNAIASYER